MNSFNGTRHRRNILDLSGFAPIHFPLTNYSTESSTKEMKHAMGDTLFINNLHLIPDPLKKNLADSVITGEEKHKPSMVETKEAERPPRPDYIRPSLAGITSFFSGVLNVMGAIFQKRAASSTSEYYDCFDDYSDQQMAPSPWQSSKLEVQNKNERDLFGSNNEVNTNLEVEMSADCKIAANHCQEKLNQVRLLLANRINKNVQSPKLRPRRPRKAFVEAGSVEDSFEDAFSPEDFINIANDSFIEYYSPFNNHNEEFLISDAPRVKTEMCFIEPTDIIHTLPHQSNDKQNLNEKTVINDNCFVNKEVVTSCEDKVNKLKALLQSKRTKNLNNASDMKNNELDASKPIPIPIHRSDPVEGVGSETVFCDDICSTKLDNSQDNNFFNEVTGKFFSSSVESEDSFQIVFSDSPQNCRRRIPSDCDSEDSFIVFEESPDSCYTSHDVFGEDIVGDRNNSDSDSDVEEDSGITCKLAPNLSRTFGDLSDDSLYSHDVVDSVKECQEICSNNVKDLIAEESRGLLLNERRKLEKQKLPSKKVTFSTQPPKVHVMRVWAYAARQARVGHWERHALDRERFKRRIADVEMAISWVFQRQHRTRIVFQRFRPWWNAERRRELAEKKEKEDMEKERKKEEERMELETQSQVNDDVVNYTDDLINNTDTVTFNSTDNEDSAEIFRENIVHNGTNNLYVDINGYIGKHGDRPIDSKQDIDVNNIESRPNNNVSNNLNVHEHKNTEIFNSKNTFKTKNTLNEDNTIHKITPGNEQINIVNEKYTNEVNGLNIKDPIIHT